MEKLGSGGSDANELFVLMHACWKAAAPYEPHKRREMVSASTIEQSVVLAKLKKTRQQESNCAPKQGTPVQ